MKHIVKNQNTETIQYELIEEDFRKLFKNDKLKGLPLITTVSGSITFTWITNNITMEPRE